MLGVLVNTVTVLIGSTVGCFLKKGFPKRVSDAIMVGLGMCTLFIGISGMFDGSDPLILILSVAIGAAIGSALRLDDGIHKLGQRVEAKFRRGSGGPSLSEGFVSGCLLFCVGAMTIVGSLNAGFGDNTMLLTKSFLDLVSSMILAVTLGPGVVLSSLFVLIFQGGLALLAVYLRPLMTEALIGELTCVGSLMVAFIGLNLMGITKIKTADYLPSLVLVPVLYYVMTLIH